MCHSWVLIIMFTFQLLSLKGWNRCDFCFWELRFFAVICFVLGYTQVVVLTINLIRLKPQVG